MMDLINKELVNSPDCHPRVTINIYARSLGEDHQSLLFSLFLEVQSCVTRRIK